MADDGFWLLPLRRAAMVAEPSPWVLALLAACALAILTFCRANRAGCGHLLAAFACVPVVQLPALALAAVLALFVAAPLTIGIVTGWLVNRDDGISLGRTMRHAMTATAFGTLAIVMFAFKGVVCVAMAAPLGVWAAALRAALGRVCIYRIPFTGEF